jgi:hypothetical protein
MQAYLLFNFVSSLPHSDLFTAFVCVAKPASPFRPNHIVLTLSARAQNAPKQNMGG